MPRCIFLGNILLEKHRIVLWFGVFCVSLPPISLMANNYGCPYYKVESSKMPKGSGSRH